MSKYGVFPGPYFPIFGLNTKIYSVNLRIQSKNGKMRARIPRIWTLFTKYVCVFVCVCVCVRVCVCECVCVCNASWPFIETFKYISIMNTSLIFRQVTRLVRISIFKNWLNHCMLLRVRKQKKKVNFIVLVKDFCFRDIKRVRNESSFKVVICKTKLLLWYKIYVGIHSFEIQLFEFFIL